MKNIKEIIPIIFKSSTGRAVHICKEGIGSDKNIHLNYYVTNNGFHYSNNYLNDQMGSVKSGSFSINTLKLILNDDSIIYLSVGDKFNLIESTDQLEPIEFEIINIGHDFEENSQNITIMEKSGSETTADVKSIYNRLFSIKQQPELEFPVNINPDYTIEEIEHILNIIVDKSDVQEWLFEFKKYKDPKFRALIPIIEEFKMPDKWKIRLTPDNRRTVGEWFNKNRQNNSSVNFCDYEGEYLRYPVNRSDSHRCALVKEELLKNYITITTEQFMKHIYKPQQKVPF